LAEPGEDAFWQFALTADGKSPLLPLLLNRSALEVQVGPAPVGSRADFRDLTLRMINGHFQVDSRIRVVRISPSRLAVGEMFNRQPTGDSAIWVDCVNATRSTEVVFDGVVLKSVAASPVVVTALVPPSLVATSGKKRISLRDSSLGLESEPDWVEVGLKAK
jgi:hypothetical protein